jgi:hypothetical protein
LLLLFLALRIDGFNQFSEAEGDDGGDNYSLALTRNSSSPLAAQHFRCSEALSHADLPRRADSK